jgi:hypothetical protein
MEDDAHSFWLYTACGLVHIGRPELDGLAAAVERDKDTKHNLQATVFDTSDGVRSLSSGGHFSPQVAKSSDGKLWFLPWDGVSVVDPRHLPFNRVPPPVHVEQFIADHKTYDATSAGSGRLRLPPLVRDLEIDYTALSLAAPDTTVCRVCASALSWWGGKLVFKSELNSGTEAELTIPASIAYAKSPIARRWMSSEKGTG